MSRPGVLFALVGISGLFLPLVHLRPNRIVPGEGIALTAGFAVGPLIAAGLAAILTAGCLGRWSPWLRTAAALLGLVGVISSLGLAAGHLLPKGNGLARVAPASGFWLLLAAFALMLADGLTRLRPSVAASWLILAGVLALAATLLGSGLLDQVSVMREYATRRGPFLAETQTHLALAFGSLGLALAVGLPLGVAIYLTARVRGPVLTVLNIVQTIPSLALFGIMIPLLGWIATLPGADRLGVSGIGSFPALVALFLYALLPVVSNTLSGLQGVPLPVREAALGLGMTRGQLLAQVLIPLALPSLLAAVRIVLVQNIGLAVIAGLIGGGGFGTFVFQGLNQTAMDLVLLGALPTIALALLAGIVMDLLLGMSRGAQA
ncbi:ABC transporter permease [Paracoccus sp. PAR01]|uniref:ABC transporter permease n=1 Tax=Paracoccus sp. PAR01 TaxID=2769282 RepID=UPI00178137F9|nr:ABC transporter permease [Paracoccus sp. PAR01]MBD9528513.1 ABC transporter permease [Paracoccus sp. PAR01]